MGITAKEIRELRFKLGLSQSAFAAKLGVTKNTVWRWEQPGASHVPPNGLHEYGLRLLEGANGC